MKTALLFKPLLVLFVLLIPIAIWAQEKTEETEKKEKKEYVIVDGSSNEAVIQDQTDFFEQKPLCRLLQNQSVTVTDSTDGEYVLIKAICEGKEVTGWVKKRILAKEPLQNKPRVSESGGVGTGVAIAGPGTIGYGPIDTTGFKNMEVPAPWGDIDLNSYEAKIIIADPPTFNHRLIWPIIGAALVTTTAIILINNDGGDDDAQTPLFLSPDEASANCNESITVDVLANDQGEGLLISSSQSTSATVEIINNTLFVSEFSQSTHIINYTATDAFGNSGSSTLTILADYPAINAQNDDYLMEFNSSINGNLLTNDIGQEISITEYTQPSTGILSLQDNGDFAYQSQIGFSGSIQFSYDIQDACGQLSNATVSITINEDPCVFDVTFETTNASCGFADGMILSTVTPTGNYTFLWSNGLVEQNLMNAFSGDYTLSVSDTTLNCTLDFSVTVDENPPSYISDLVVTPAICPNAGNISFLASSPDGGTMNIQVEFNFEIFDFIVPTGEFILGDYMPIAEGNYSIWVSPSNNPGSCFETINVEIENQVILIIDINDIINPSSISANDGAIFGTVLSPIFPPFELFVNGNPIIIDDVMFALEGLTEGTYSLYVISSDGCISDTVIVELIADPKNDSRISFILTYSSQKPSNIPELPGNTRHQDFSLQIEFSTGNKLYQPIIGFAYSVEEFNGKSNAHVLELNCPFEKIFIMQDLKLGARVGPFTKLAFENEGAEKTNLLSYGLLFQPMIEYKIFESNRIRPIQLLLRVGARFDLASEGNESGYFIGLRLNK